ncbi:MAG: DUF4197 domain-containing protein, partial [Candidatus Deferrimicrobiaceae bacterium]
MRRFVSLTVFCFALIALPSQAGLFDDIKKGIGVVAPQSGPDDSQIAGGLKEALTIGTGNAVSLVSVTDGFFANQAIRILIPDKIQKVADVLGKVGYQEQVDEFVLSMNRAAEKAAPQAKSIFVESIKEMTIEDAKQILNGGDTAATDFFKGKTSGRLSEAFKPIISSSMNDVGATRKYKEMMGEYTALPFTSAESVDLDQYVTNKSLDGLFYMVGEEEKKIRTDPAARVTDLLKTVFGSK